MIYCNIGDVQAMGNQPITYIRQLIAVCLSPKKYFEPGSNGIREHGNSHVRDVVDILSEEAVSEEEREGLRRLVEGLSPAREGRAADVLDEIPRDVKERANILLNSFGGRSLGTHENFTPIIQCIIMLIGLQAHTQIHREYLL